MQTNIDQHVVMTDTHAVGDLYLINSVIAWIVQWSSCLLICMLLPSTTWNVFTVYLSAHMVTSHH